MGANITPDTDMMRGRYIDGKHYQSKFPNHFFAGADNAGEEFDRWFEQVKAEAKAEVLQELADEAESHDSWDSALWVESQQHYITLQDWLRTRAEQIRAS